MKNKSFNKFYRKLNRGVKPDLTFFEFQDERIASLHRTYLGWIFFLFLVIDLLLLILYLIFSTCVLEVVVPKYLPVFMMLCFIEVNRFLLVRIAGEEFKSKLVAIVRKFSVIYAFSRFIEWIFRVF